MPFLAPGELERSGVRTDGVVVANPLVAEESVLRTSLLPGRCWRRSGTTRRTARPAWASSEIGHCYAHRRGAGSRRCRPSGRSWASRSAVPTPSRRSSMARVVVGSLGLDGPDGHLGRGRRVSTRRGPRSSTVGGVASARWARSTRRWPASHGIDERVAWLRIDLDRCCSIDRPLPQASPVSRFPSTDIDLAFVVDDGLAAARDRGRPPRGSRARARRPSSSTCSAGGQVGDGSRSLAFAVRLQADDRTLTDAEVAAARDALIDASRCRTAPPRCAPDVLLLPRSLATAIQLIMQ